ncbi:MAG: hypothetical protein WCE62_02735 [Polyangiales bacterium]
MILTILGRAFEPAHDAFRLFSPVHFPNGRSRGPRDFPQTRLAYRALNKRYALHRSNQIELGVIFGLCFEEPDDCRDRCAPARLTDVSAERRIWWFPHLSCQVDRNLLVRWQLHELLVLLFQRLSQKFPLALEPLTLAGPGSKQSDQW